MGDDGRPLNRRRFLAAGAGAVSSIGLVHTGEQALDESVDVRLWFSEAADAYDGIRPRATGYVRRALDGLAGEASVSVGGTVDVETEDGYRVTASGEWPKKFATGAVDPVDDVNLLLTDGDMTTSPTGIGLPYVASVGGARYVARMPRPSETDGVVGLSKRALVTQILVHECGHALGLRHNDGEILDREDHVVVTPMVSGYTLADESVRDRKFDYESSACGTSYSPVGGTEIRLALTFSPCARRRVRQLWIERL